MKRICFEFEDAPDGPWYHREWPDVPQIGWRVEFREVYRDDVPRRNVKRVAGIVTGVMASDYPLGKDQCITVTLRRVQTLVGDPQ